MRYSDPIVDEVRAARDAIAKKYEYDIERIARAIKAREVQSGHNADARDAFRDAEHGKAKPECLARFVEESLRVDSVLILREHAT